MGRKDKNIIHSQMDDELINEEILNEVAVIESFEESNNELVEDVSEELVDKSNDELDNEIINNVETEPTVDVIEVLVEKPKRTIQSLSRDEYRLFARTGKMPN